MVDLKEEVQILTTAVKHLKKALASVIVTDSIKRASGSELEDAEESESEDGDSIDVEAERLLSKAQDEEKRTAPEKWEGWMMSEETEDSSMSFEQEDELLRGLSRTQGVAWGDENESEKEQEEQEVYRRKRRKRRRKEEKG